MDGGRKKGQAVLYSNNIWTALSACFDANKKNSHEMSSGTLSVRLFRFNTFLTLFITIFCTSTSIGIIQCGCVNTYFSFNYVWFPSSHLHIIQSISVLLTIYSHRKLLWLDMYINCVLCTIIRMGQDHMVYTPTVSQWQ